MTSKIFYTPHKELWDDIVKMKVSKGDIFEGLEVTFDYALPQGWLDSLADRPYSPSYNVILSTTVWAYPPGFFSGIPVTCCIEVQQAIDKYHKGV